jgi:predicted NodU family carbamoyl transferase
MNVLGISGREREAAAAVSIDGSIVAAASEESFARVPQIGYRYTGGFPLAAIDACLTRAGLTLADIDAVSVVDDRSRAGDSAVDAVADVDQLFAASAFDPLQGALSRREQLTVSAAAADARQLAAVCDDENLSILILSLETGESSMCERRSGQLKRPQPFPGGHQLFCAIRRMASALGLPATAPYDAIERMGSIAAESDGVFDGAIRVDAELNVTVDDEQFERAIAALRGDGCAPGAAQNPRMAREAQMLASSFCSRVSAILVELMRRLRERADADRIALTGSVLSSGRLVGDLVAMLGDSVVFAAVPEPVGRALGAALLHESGPAARLESLALGPDFSEQEIKTALENCRLDYLYEPDWARLLARVSAMLSRGTVVAWFQGAMAFGPRAIGTRGILCDPSNRWARENINRFFRHGSADDPLPVAMTAAALRECVAAPVDSHFLTASAEVRPEWRDRLRAAVDRRHAIPVQLADPDRAPMLTTLLDIHRQRTGVPGLINFPFCAANEPAVCTPRDAVRTVFSSAIDALVIGRFLLMKDYWLLRSGADA